MSASWEDSWVIVETVQDWALRPDAGDWERFRTVWHEDGWMTATWFQGPADEYIELSRAGSEKGGSASCVFSAAQAWIWLASARLPSPR